MGTFSKDRLLKFKDLSWHYFDWLTVLRDAGITEVQDLSGQYLLKCPFHPDKRPSFRIRVTEHNFHCFSCNAFGTVVDLMYRLSHTSLSESQYMEQLLKSSPGMQLELGFKSLYIDSKTLDPAFNSRRRFSATNHLGSGMPLSVFASRVKSVSNDWETLVFTLTLLQEGARMEDILAQLVRMHSVVTPSQAEVKLLSLEDILSQ